MASLPSMSTQTSITFPCNNNNTSPLFLHHTTLRLNLFSSIHILPRPHSPRSTLTFARRRNVPSSPITTSSSSSSKKNKKKVSRKEASEENIEEDAFEALFKQLEEDLKNDELSLDDDEEISEEELALLERELEEALGDSDDLLELLSSTTDETQESDADVKEDGIDEDDEDDDEIKPVKLKNWQLRRLAYALKTGRRKTSIKSLAAELCLDRAVVLECLRDPPPNLLLMSAALPDKPAPIITEPEPEPEPEADAEHESVESNSAETVTDAKEPKKSKAKLPVHLMQGQWSAQKRLKKVEVETLERVYRRSKRPTNAMISSIVQVTNLPRKKIVKWFEDKRTEDGVPDKHLPYQRSSPETVFSG